MFAAPAVVSTVSDLFDFSQGASLARPDSGRFTVTLLSVSLLTLAFGMLLRRRN